MPNWTRRTFLAAMGAAAAGCQPGEGGRAGKPNVVIVLPDQLRGSALGCMGNPVVRTPNADRLAAEGALFTNASVNSPICPAGRAQLLTGRLTHSVRDENPLMSKMLLDETSVAEVLKAQGYATGYVGKWHVSPAGVASKDGYVPPGPARQGFDDWAACEIPRGHYDTVYYRDTPEPIQIRGFACHTETDLAIEFIQKNREGPFFLMVSWNPPHDPYVPPEEYDVYRARDVELRPNVPAAWERKARVAIARYYGMIGAVDDNLGRLLGALDETGVADDTIVVFTSDHGDMLYSQHDHWQEGHKKRPWRESRNVPLIVRYPRGLAGGQSHDDLVGIVDVMPTLLGLAGFEGPGGEGVDFSPLLRGETFRSPESVFLYMQAFVDRSTPFDAPWRAVLTRDALFAASAGVKGHDWLLYDLVNDPYEMENRIDDPAFRSVRERMWELLTEHRRQVGELPGLV